MVSESCNVQRNPSDCRVFGDKADPPNYVGFRRDAVELHMQFQFEHEMGTIRLRFLVEDPDALFNGAEPRSSQESIRPVC
jgi:hypothetical protein